MPKAQLLPTQITNIKVILHINNGSSDILAFAEVHFNDNSGNVVFKVKGFKIKTFKGNYKSSLSVDFPSYQTGGVYRKSFIAEGELFGFVKDRILEQYQQITNTSTFTEDEVDDLITT